MVVVSFGSINVDKVTRVNKEELEKLNSLNGFPDSGETVEFESIPNKFKSFDFRVFLGGKGANQGVASGKAGSKTFLLGKVGRDSQNYNVLQKLGGRGVDTGEIGFCDRKTGCTYIFIDDEGENRICYLKGGNKAVDKDYADQNFELILNSNVLLLQNEIRIETSKYLLKRLENYPEKRPYIILDPSPVENSKELLDYKSIDLITPNKIEYKQLKEHINELRINVLKTLGEDGAELNGNLIKTPKVEPEDTTAAGDVLNGYIASGINKGLKLEKSVKIGVKAATISTKKIGAQNSIPTKKQMKKKTELSS